MQHICIIFIFFVNIKYKCKRSSAFICAHNHKLLIIIFKFPLFFLFLWIIYRKHSSWRLKTFRIILCVFACCLGRIRIALTSTSTIFNTAFMPFYVCFSIIMFVGQFSIEIIIFIISVVEQIIMYLHCFFEEVSLQQHFYEYFRQF